MPYLAGLIFAAAIVLALWWLFTKRNAPNARGRDLMELRQAENKVKVSDPILRRDIDIL